LSSAIPLSSTRFRAGLQHICSASADAAINLLETTFPRYFLLVNGTICDPLVPLDDYDVQSDFKKIWP